MSTRSVLEVKDEEGKSLVKIYRQSDGYPTGRGQDLKDLFQDAKFCNGIGSGNNENTHNGMGCFAASVVMKEKQEAGIGGIYLYSGPVTGEEYGYILEPMKQSGEGLSRVVSALQLTIYHGSRKIYKGQLKDADMKAIEKADNGEDE